MKADELMLGNWYRSIHEESESYHQVDIEFLTNQLAYDENPNDDIFSRGWPVEPIPLNASILEKAGFEYLEYRSKWQLAKGDFYQLVEGDTGEYCLFNGISYIGVPIKYLHQLQNLYFALTGTPLIIEL